MKFKKAKKLFDEYNTKWEGHHIYEHGMRVMRYSMKVCEELGINDNYATEIQLAARYHDIGKMKYPPKMFEQGRKFTKKDIKTFMNHVKYSYDILKGFYGDQYSIADLVLYHHERLDGSGYLKGLKGEEIPLGSRIITVCDAYDAMFRHYNLKTEEEAIAELKRYKGKCFDGKVVDALLKVLGKK